MKMSHQRFLLVLVTGCFLALVKSTAYGEFHQGSSQKNISEVYELSGMRLPVFWKKKPKSSGKVVLVPTIARGDHFVGQISLGSPESKFWVKFDSQSPFLWAFDSSVRGDAKLLPADDSDEGMEEEGFNRTFFDLRGKDKYGKSEFILGTDFGEKLSSDAYVGGKMIRNGVSLSFVDSIGVREVYQNMPLAVVNKIEGEGTHERCNGIDGSMGLALGSEYVSPAMQLLLGQNTKDAFDQPVVSFFVSPKTGDKGHVLFGGIDNNLFSGKKLTYVPILSSKKGNPDFEWKIGFTKVTYGKLTKLKGAVAAIATSAPVLYVPTPLFEEIMMDSETEFNCHPMVRPLPNHCKAACDALPEVHDIQFYTHKKKQPLFSIAIGDYSSGPLPKEKWTIAREPQCLLAIQDSMSETDFILGHPFFKKYYTVLNFGKKNKKPKIGFALAKEKE